MGLQRVVKWVVVAAGVGIGVLALSACQPPQHRTFRVDTSIDSVDADPGDGACLDAAGHCSLRAAIGEDNAQPVSRMTDITLGTDVDQSIASTTADNDSGDLDVTGHVTIFGNGHTVDAHGIDRVLHQRSGDLVLRDVTLTGGSVTDAGGTGGGVLAEGNLVLFGVHVSHNQVTGFAGKGGGIFAGGSAQVVVADSVIDGNSAD